MSQPHGIIVFGANGSGKTTLGRELARLLGYKHIDIEDYAFDESEVPYAKPRSRDEYTNLMLADIEKHCSFVISTVIGDLGDVIPRFYHLAVHISVPHEIRMERIKQRSYAQNGERVCEGGDMVEQEKQFMDFVASRSLTKIERWSETLTCPIINVDGTKDWKVSAASIAKRYYDITMERDGIRNAD